jgi:hypothetical protein
MEVFGVLVGASFIGGILAIGAAVLFVCGLDQQK